MSHDGGTLNRHVVAGTRPNQVNCWPHTWANIAASRCYDQQRRRRRSETNNPPQKKKFRDINCPSDTRDACSQLRAYLLCTSVVFVCSQLQKRLDQVPSIKTICSQGGKNLLLTDKSLPSLGCNGSHLSFFSEYCPAERQALRQTASMAALCLKVTHMFAPPGPVFQQAGRRRFSRAKTRRHWLA